MNSKDFDQAYESLTPKQKQALKPFLAGESEEAIAAQMDVTDPSTVRRHIANVCRNFGFVNEPGEHFSQREELVKLFAKHKPDWVSLEVRQKYYVDDTIAIADLEFPEGPVALNSSFYLQRSRQEPNWYEAILQPGALIRIKAPRQMGKTSLLNRILDRADKDDCRTVRLNLLQAEAEVFSNLDKFLRWLCACVSQKLQLPPQLDRYWDKDRGSKINCTTYFEAHLLEQVENPIVLALDEVDRLFDYPEIAQDFFPLLRSWHEEAKTMEIWEQLRLVVVHSTEDYGRLDINQSPFNVGLPIELGEFTPDLVRELARRHQLDWSDRSLQQLMAMVGGHPNLVRQALYRLSRQEVTLEQLLQNAPTDAGIYNAHLRRHLETLQQQAELSAALKSVVSSNEPVRIETMQGYKLYSMGLIQREGDRVLPRCELYRQYFRDRI